MDFIKTTLPQALNWSKQPNPRNILCRAQIVRTGRPGNHRPRSSHPAFNYISSIARMNTQTDPGSIIPPSSHFHSAPNNAPDRITRTGKHCPALDLFAFLSPRTVHDRTVQPGA
ncbi:unnamed protein product [Microthlaspi erraticum]|uniref:Uncharacterized protein n=1 Tax=Microthlaspi erraticum TaxID=1685480 RepID=A0A6D2JKA7_9BRAS|nr:unnamed protein product [Microthlaspi erraticum]